MTDGIWVICSFYPSRKNGHGNGCCQCPKSYNQYWNDRRRHPAGFFFSDSKTLILEEERGEGGGRGGGGKVGQAFLYRCNRMSQAPTQRAPGPTQREGPRAPGCRRRPFQYNQRRKTSRPPKTVVLVKLYYQTRKIQPFDGDRCFPPLHSRAPTVGPGAPCLALVSGPGGPLPALFVSGLSALALLASGRARLAVGPGSSRLLCHVLAVCKRPGQGPTICMLGPGALCRGLALCLLGPALFASGPGGVPPAPIRAAPRGPPAPIHVPRSQLPSPAFPFSRREPQTLLFGGNACEVTS